MVFKKLQTYLTSAQTSKICSTTTPYHTIQPYHTLIWWTTAVLAVLSQDLVIHSLTAPYHTITYHTTIPYLSRVYYCSVGSLVPVPCNGPFHCTESFCHMRKKDKKQPFCSVKTIHTHDYMSLQINSPYNFMEY